MPPRKKKENPKQDKPAPPPDRVAKASNKPDAAPPKGAAAKQAAGSKAKPGGGPQPMKAKPSPKPSPKVTPRGGGGPPVPADQQLPASMSTSKGTTRGRGKQEQQAQQDADQHIVPMKAPAAASSSTSSRPRGPGGEVLVQQAQQEPPVPQVTNAKASAASAVPRNKAMAFVIHPGSNKNQTSYKKPTAANKEQAQPMNPNRPALSFSWNTTKRQKVDGKSMQDKNSVLFENAFARADDDPEERAGDEQIVAKIDFETEQKNRPHQEPPAPEKAAKQPPPIPPLDPPTTVAITEEEEKKLKQIELFQKNILGRIQVRNGGKDIDGEYLLDPAKSGASNSLVPQRKFKRVPSVLVGPRPAASSSPGRGNHQGEQQHVSSAEQEKQRMKNFPATIIFPFQTRINGQPHIAWKFMGAPEPQCVQVVKPKNIDLKKVVGEILTAARREMMRKKRKIKKYNAKMMLSMKQKESKADGPADPTAGDSATAVEQVEAAAKGAVVQHPTAATAASTSAKNLVSTSKKTTYSTSATLKTKADVVKKDKPGSGSGNLQRTNGSKSRPRPLKLKLDEDILGIFGRYDRAFRSRPKIAEHKPHVNTTQEQQRKMIIKLKAQKAKGARMLNKGNYKTGSGGSSALKKKKTKAALKSMLQNQKTQSKTKLGNEIVEPVLSSKSASLKSSPLAAPSDEGDQMNTAVRINDAGQKLGQHLPEDESGPAAASSSTAKTAAANKDVDTTIGATTLPLSSKLPSSGTTTITRHTRMNGFYTLYRTKEETFGNTANDIWIGPAKKRLFHVRVEMKTSKPNSQSRTIIYDLRPEKPSHRMKPAFACDQALFVLAPSVLCAAKPAPLVLGVEPFQQNYSKMNNSVEVDGNQSSRSFLPIEVRHLLSVRQNTWQRPGLEVKLLFAKNVTKDSHFFTRDVLSLPRTSRQGEQGPHGDFDILKTGSIWQNFLYENRHALKQIVRTRRGLVPARNKTTLTNRGPALVIKGGPATSSSRAIKNSATAREQKKSGDKKLEKLWVLPKVNKRPSATRKLSLLHRTNRRTRNISKKRAKTVSKPPKLSFFGAQLKKRRILVRKLKEKAERASQSVIAIKNQLLYDQDEQLQRAFYLGGSSLEHPEVLAERDEDYNSDFHDLDCDNLQDEDLDNLEVIYQQQQQEAGNLDSNFQALWSTSSHNPLLHPGPPGGGAATPFSDGFLSPTKFSDGGTSTRLSISPMKFGALSPEKMIEGDGEQGTTTIPQFFRVPEEKSYDGVEDDFLGRSILHGRGLGYDDSDGEDDLEIIQQKAMEMEQGITSLGPTFAGGVGDKNLLDDNTVLMNDLNGSMMMPTNIAEHQQLASDAKNAAFPTTSNHVGNGNFMAPPLDNSAQEHQLDDFNSMMNPPGLFFHPPADGAVAPAAAADYGMHYGPGGFILDGSAATGTILAGAPPPPFAGFVASEAAAPVATAAPPQYNNFNQPLPSVDENEPLVLNDDNPFPELQLSSDKTTAHVVKRKLKRGTSTTASAQQAAQELQRPPEAVERHQTVAPPPPPIVDDEEAVLAQDFLEDKDQLNLTGEENELQGASTYKSSAEIIEDLEEFFEENEVEEEQLDPDVENRLQHFLLGNPHRSLTNELDRLENDDVENLVYAVPDLLLDPAYHYTAECLLGSSATAMVQAGTMAPGDDLHTSRGHATLANNNKISKTKAKNFSAEEMIQKRNNALLWGSYEELVILGHPKLRMNRLKRDQFGPLDMLIPRKLKQQQQKFLRKMSNDRAVDEEEADDLYFHGDRFGAQEHHLHQGASFGGHHGGQLHHENSEQRKFNSAKMSRATSYRDRVFKMFNKKFYQVKKKLKKQEIMRDAERKIERLRKKKEQKKEQKQAEQAAKKMKAVIKKTTEPPKKNSKPSRVSVLAKEQEKSVAAVAEYFEDFNSKLHDVVKVDDFLLRQHHKARTAAAAMKAKEQATGGTGTTTTSMKKEQITTLTPKATNTTKYPRWKKNLFQYLRFQKPKPGQLFLVYPPDSVGNDNLLMRQGESLESEKCSKALPKMAMVRILENGRKDQNRVKILKVDFINEEIEKQKRNQQSSDLAKIRKEHAETSHWAELLEDEGPYAVERRKKHKILLKKMDAKLNPNWIPPSKQKQEMKKMKIFLPPAAAGSSSVGAGAAAPSGQIIAAPGVSSGQGQHQQVTTTQTAAGAPSTTASAMIYKPPAVPHLFAGSTTIATTVQAVKLKKETLLPPIEEEEEGQNAPDQRKYAVDESDSFIPPPAAPRAPPSRDDVEAPADEPPVVDAIFGVEEEDEEPPPAAPSLLHKADVAARTAAAPYEDPVEDVVEQPDGMVVDLEGEVENAKDVEQEQSASAGAEDLASSVAALSSAAGGRAATGTSSSVVPQQKKKSNKRPRKRRNFSSSSEPMSEDEDSAEEQVFSGADHDQEAVVPDGDQIKPAEGDEQNEQSEADLGLDIELNADLAEDLEAFFGDGSADEEQPMDDGNLKVDLPEQDEQNRDAEQNAVKPTRQQVVDIRSKDHQNVVNPPSSSPQPSSSVAGRGEEREPVLMQQIQHLGQSSGSGSSSAGVVSGMMNVVQDNEGRRGGVKMDDKELLHPQELVDNTPSSAANSSIVSSAFPNTKSQLGVTGGGNNITGTAAGPSTTSGGNYVITNPALGQAQHHHLISTIPNRLPWPKNVLRNMIDELPKYAIIPKDIYRHRFFDPSLNQFFHASNKFKREYQLEKLFTEQAAEKARAAAAAASSLAQKMLKSGVQQHATPTTTLGAGGHNDGNEAVTVKNPAGAVAVLPAPATSTSVHSSPGDVEAAVEMTPGGGSSFHLGTPTGSSVVGAASSSVIGARNKGSSAVLAGGKKPKFTVRGATPVVAQQERPQQLRSVGSKLPAAGDVASSAALTAPPALKHPDSMGWISWKKNTPDTTLYYVQRKPVPDWLRNSTWLATLEEDPGKLKEMVLQHNKNPALKPHGTTIKTFVDSAGTIFVNGLPQAVCMSCVSQYCFWGKYFGEHKKVLEEEVPMKEEDNCVEGDLEGEGGAGTSNAEDHDDQADEHAAEEVDGENNNNYNTKNRRRKKATSKSSSYQQESIFWLDMDPPFALLEWQRVEEPDHVLNDPMERYVNEFLYKNFGNDGVDKTTEEERKTAVETCNLGLLTGWWQFTKKEQINQKGQIVPSNHLQSHRNITTTSRATGVVNTPGGRAANGTPLHRGMNNRVSPVLREVKRTEKVWIDENGTFQCSAFGNAQLQLEVSNELGLRLKNLHNPNLPANKIGILSADKMRIKWVPFSKWVRVETGPTRPEAATRGTKGSTKPK
ncbi:unnamed protein product [Amoebophrya sp. A120]|nr:unnamed protein product [Amoebophrya sp. A120]|eukprot:GSA120T00013422001.1